jgi:hypothetical protein
MPRATIIRPQRLPHHCQCKYHRARPLRTWTRCACIRAGPEAGSFALNITMVHHQVLLSGESCLARSMGGAHVGPAVGSARMCSSAAGQSARVPAETGRCFASWQPERLRPLGFWPRVVQAPAVDRAVCWTLRWSCRCRLKSCCARIELEKPNLAEGHQCTGSKHILSSLSFS